MEVEKRKVSKGAEEKEGVVVKVSEEEKKKGKKDKKNHKTKDKGCVIQKRREVEEGEVVEVA